MRYLPGLRTALAGPTPHRGTAGVPGWRAAVCGPAATSPWLSPFLPGDERPALIQEEAEEKPGDFSGLQVRETAGALTAYPLVELVVPLLRRAKCPSDPRLGSGPLSPTNSEDDHSSCWGSRCRGRDRRTTRFPRPECPAGAFWPGTRPRRWLRESSERRPRRCPRPESADPPAAAADLSASRPVVPVLQQQRSDGS